MRSTFKLLFYINRNKVKSDGTTAVLCRISIDGKKSAVTTGVYCKPGDWDSKKCEIKTARENNRLAAFRSRLEEAYGMFISQVLYIGKGQPGQRTKHEYVPDRLQAGNGEFLFQKYVQFLFRKERPVRFCLFKMNLQKRIVRYPFVHKRHFYYLLEVFQIFYRGILGT